MSDSALADGGSPIRVRVIPSGLGVAGWSRQGAQICIFVRGWLGDGTSVAAAMPVNPCRGQAN